MLHHRPQRHHRPRIVQPHPLRPLQGGGFAHPRPFTQAPQAGCRPGCQASPQAVCPPIGQPPQVQAPPSICSDARLSARATSPTQPSWALRPGQHSAKPPIPPSLVSPSPLHLRCCVQPPQRRPPPVSALPQQPSPYQHGAAPGNCWFQTWGQRRWRGRRGGSCVFPPTGICHCCQAVIPDAPRRRRYHA